MNEKLDQELYLPLIILALEEDLHSGDVSTEAMVYHGDASAHIIAKENGVLAGTDVVEAVFLRLDSSLKIKKYSEDGSGVSAGESVLSIAGNGAAILSAERTALNFLGRMSGVATMTHHFTEAISHTHCRILDTRKTMPLLRDLDKYAVRCGGGQNHRRGLYDMILIKENHIRYAGSLEAAIDRALAWRDKYSPDMKIEIETTALDECRRAMRYPVDIIMLDHFNLKNMQCAVTEKPAGIQLEASGNVSLATVREIAETGVDFISVGAITHSASVFDFSLLFQV